MDKQTNQSGISKRAEQKVLRLGIIGAGGWVRQAYIPALQRCRDIVLTALCSRRKWRVEELARAHGVPNIFTRYSDLLGLAEVDAVAVVTPNHLHHPVTMDALRAGKHVLCEKPLAMNVARAEEMYALAKRLKLCHATAFTWRFAPAALHIKQLIEQGYVGQVLQANFTWFMGSPDAPLTWKFLRNQAGTGCLGNVGSHLIDWARWLVGEIAEVCGRLGTHVRYRRTLDNNGKGAVEVDDTCAFLAAFQSGAVGTFHIGMGRSFQRFEISGSEGTLVYEMPLAALPVGRLFGSRDEDALEPIALPARLLVGLGPTERGRDAIGTFIFPCLLRAFRERIAGRSGVPSFYDGVEAQRVIDAVVASHETGEWITVSPGR